MPVGPVLVDSSYYIGLLRAGRDPLRTLAVASITGDLACCGVVRCEVGRGLREPRVRQRMKSFWDVMINVPTDNRLWNEVEQTLWELDRRGNVLPLADVVIGCSARRIGAAILTLDRHFEFIPGLRVIDHLEE